MKPTDGPAKPWRVRWHDPSDHNGRQRRRAELFRHQRDARAFQAKKQAEIDRGDPMKPHAAVTLDELLCDFSRTRTSRLRPGAVAGYNDMMARLRKHFGEAKPIEQIDQRHAEAFVASFRRVDGRRGDLGDSTIARYTTYARRIFGAAVSWGWLARNPFKPEARSDSVLNTRGRAADRDHIRPVEFLRIVGLVPSLQLRALLWLMYGSGLRPGEAHNVRVDQIDLAAGQVHIRNRKASDDVPLFEIKCDRCSQKPKERKLPIPPAALPDLQAAMSVALASGGFVGLTAKRYATVRDKWHAFREMGRPWRNEYLVNNIRRNTLRAVDEAKIELKHTFRLYLFRKAFGQNHADAGAPPANVGRHDGALGHTGRHAFLQQA